MTELEKNSIDHDMASDDDDDTAGSSTHTGEKIPVSSEPIFFHSCLSTPFRPMNGSLFRIANWG